MKGSAEELIFFFVAIPPPPKKKNKYINKTTDVTVVHHIRAISYSKEMSTLTLPYPNLNEP